LAGAGRAFEFAALGQDIPADEALRAGLVNHVVPAAELESTVLEQARRLAAGPARAIGLAKRGLRAALAAGLHETLSYEAQLQQIASETADHREALSAFLEKRPPRFSGS
jgi:2-(1,2-epoxy-1,2-dihydrophenyl)acetyl-CoA isomerase